MINEFTLRALRDARSEKRKEFWLLHVIKWREKMHCSRSFIKPSPEKERLSKCNQYFHSNWIELSKYTHTLALSSSHFDSKMVLECWSLCNMLIRCWAYFIHIFNRFRMNYDALLSVGWRRTNAIRRKCIGRWTAAAVFSRVNEQKKNLFHFRFH